MLLSIVRWYVAHVSFPLCLPRAWCEILLVLSRQQRPTALLYTLDPHMQLPENSIRSL